MKRNNIKNKFKTGFKTLLQSLLLPVILLLLWYIVCAEKIFSPFLLPSPEAVLDATGELILDGSLQKHISISLLRVITGFSLSVLFALPLGVICGRSNSFYRFCRRPLEFFRHVPPLSLIPLIILWAGIGELSKLIIIFLASFFPLFLNTCSGIRNCDPKLLEVGRNFGFTSKEEIIHIQLPAALSPIIAGLRLSLGYSWRALIGAELIAAASGIGYLILDAEEMSRPDVVLTGVFCIGIIGSIMDKLFELSIMKAFPWYKAAAENKEEQ